MLKDITWPAAFTVVGVLTAVTLLAVLDADTQVITNVLLALGVGGGLGVLNGVKNNVNGNMSELQRLLRQAIDRLAVSTPPQREE